MSIIKNINKNEIRLNDKEAIIEEEKSEDGYEWKEVTFKSEDMEFDIGSYYTYNYSYSTEWMEYNSEYIVLMAVYVLGFDEISEPQVNVMFDIKSKSFIMGSSEELRKIYNNSFKKNQSYTKKLTMNW